MPGKLAGLDAYMYMCMCVMYAYNLCIYDTHTHSHASHTHTQASLEDLTQDKAVAACLQACSLASLVPAAAEEPDEATAATKGPDGIDMDGSSFSGTIADSASPGDGAGEAGGRRMSLT